MMKYILFTCLFATINSTITPEIIGFVHGYAVGTGIAAEMPDIFDCAQDINIVIPVTRIIINELKKGDLESVVHGIQDLGKALSEFSETCGDFAIEVNNIVKDVGSIVNQPNLWKTIEKNAYENAELVGRTIANSIKYLQNEDGYSAGFETGQLVRILLNQ